MTVGVYPPKRGAHAQGLRKVGAIESQPDIRNNGPSAAPAMGVALRTRPAGDQARVGAEHTGKWNLRREEEFRGPNMLIRCLLFVCLAAGSGSVFAQTEPETQPATAPPEHSEVSAASDPSPDKTPQVAQQSEDEAAAFKPRVELFIPSTEHLIRRTGESHLGGLLGHLSGLLSAQVASGKGLTPEDWEALANLLRACRDTSVGVATFAPTTEGRPRWMIRVDWPRSELRDLISRIIALPALEDTLEGVTLAGSPNEGYELSLGDKVMAVIVAGPKGEGVILSDPDLAPPESLYGADVERSDPPKDTSTLIYSRWNLTATEKDSGALFGTTISWVGNIRYQASVRRSGQWSERFGVSWNALVGAAAKATIKRAKQSFHVPREAFAAVVVSSPLLQGMLDGIAGLVPGVLMGDLGALAGDRVGPEVCIAILPGTGILPLPEVVFQTRCRHPSSVMAAIHRAITSANKRRRKDDLPEAWHEISMDDRTVFYHDGRGEKPVGLSPATYRRVLFTNERTDPKGRQRTFLNIAFVTTDVEAFVRQWSAPMRSAQRVALPSAKVDGQGWLHWEMLYDHLHPWLNLAIAGIDPGAVLPATNRIKPYLRDASITLKTQYTGMMIRHAGPFPIGTVYLPIVLANSLAADESASTDLSRERIACERLKLFYANAELFRKDVGRWPVRVAELDGYVDFQGNPWLLRLRRSSRGALRESLLGLMTEDEEPEDEEDEIGAEIDDSLFEIDWIGEEWTLGVRSGTLDHLDALYINQRGVIHRAVKAQWDGDAVETQDDDEDESAEG